MSREELLAQNPEARAMYEKLQSLRSSVDAIKDQPQQQVKQAAPAGEIIGRTESRSKAAEEVIRQKAEKEALEKKLREERAEQARQEQQRQMEEAARRAASKQREAQRMRARAEAASRQAELAAKVQSADVEEMLALQQEAAAGTAAAGDAARKGGPQDREDPGRTLDLQEREDPGRTLDLEEVKETLKSAQETQSKTLDQISGIADRATMQLSASQQQQIRTLTSAQEKARRERDAQRRQLKEQLEQSRARRKAEEIAARQEQEQREAETRREAAARKEELKRAEIEERARLKAEKQARAVEAAIARKARAEKEAAEKRARAMAAAKAKEERRAKEQERKQKELDARRAREEEEARIREERKDKARALWKQREEQRQEKRRRKQQERLREIAQKREVREEVARYRRALREQEDERRRLKQIKEDDAALGGGLVTIHDITIKTEINKRENIRLRDLLGLPTKAERRAKSEEERLKLQLEREYRREDARAKFSFNNMLSARTWQNSVPGKAVQRFGAFCDRHKRGIITASSAVATVLVCTATVFNLCTAYEYSYNGTALGVVENKDDVLAVTELVESAMSEDSNLSVIIGSDDITFRRVSVLGGVSVDTTEDVLKRLTYMGDYKVTSYGIYVDGSKVGAVRTKEEAQEVLQDLKNTYTSKAEKSEVEEAVFLENVEVRECNTKLENLYRPDGLVDALTTETEKETVHTVVAGETLEDIAAAYGTTEKKLLADNNGLSSGTELAAGTPVVIKEIAPPVTVRITEKIQYSETIRYETERTEDDEVYEGDDEVTQEGKNGKREITARITTVNGETIDREELKNVVTKEPVTKKITVGTKERPPTVGDGKFSCPIHDTFHKTTGFEMRWGRFHKGVDLACPTGTSVYAADGGTVVTASYKPSYGNLVEIDHQNGYLTKYAHNSKILVNVGDKVYEGQEIAKVGSTGNSTGPHCHFEVRYNGEPKNPLNYITLDGSGN